MTTLARIDSDIAHAERGLRDPRVRGAFRDRQIANGQKPWSDARVRRAVAATLRDLRAQRAQHA